MAIERPQGRQLVALKNRIVQHFASSHWIELGELTGTLDHVDRHPRLLRSLSWGDPDYDGVALTMIKDIIDAHPDNTAILLDYVGKHCPDGGEFVSSQDDGSRRITFSPSVFRIPDGRVDDKLVSVMMPFSESMRAVYDTIRAAAQAAGFQCTRADDIWDDSTVIQDVFSLIFRSFIVICDFTGRNPNVFYEAGIAHTLGKHVIPITQSEEHIPADIRHHRYATYLNNTEGLRCLQIEVENRLRTLATRQRTGPLV